VTHPAVRLEDRVIAALAARLRSRGYLPAVFPATGYGYADGPDSWARILARVLLAPGDYRHEPRDLRGWRRFATLSAPGVTVRVQLGDELHEVVSDRDGYVDVRVPCHLGAGWHEVALSTPGRDPVSAGVRIVDATTRLGLVSDLDDTVIVTFLPRPLVAFRNAFVARESTRRPVPGMARLYAEVVARHPDVFVVYLSTGAWNAAGPMTSFLAHHGFPRGPLLMTDWGPTPDAWFRSGRRHKQESLDRLFDELPRLRWLLVGDDGQHDPDIYAEAAGSHPDRVLAIAIRQLPLGERVAGRGNPVPPSEGVPEGLGVPEVRGQDGLWLRDALAGRGILLGP
jgi:phosphatidate phosphatase APP1